MPEDRDLMMFPRRRLRPPVNFVPVVLAVVAIIVVVIALLGTTNLRRRLFSGFLDRAHALETTSWRLRSLAGESYDGDPTVTLTFDDTHLHGFAGCNFYDTGYTLERRRFTLAGGPPSTTGVTCSEAEMRLETAFFDALRRAQAYAISADGMLQLYDGEDQVLMTLVSREAPLPDRALAATAWTLLTLHGVTPLEDTQITLHFDEVAGEGNAGGYTGCNWYGGPYEIAPDGVLRFGEFSQTAQGCAAPVMEQERIYMETLRSAARYSAGEDYLEIRNAAGDVILRYAPQLRFASDPAELIATEWRLTSRDGTPVESLVTLTFYDAQTAVIGAEGRLYHILTYNAQGDTFMVTASAVATATDQPDYAALLDLLTQAQPDRAHYQLRRAALEPNAAPGLTFFTEQGRVLVYEPLPDDLDAPLETTLWQLGAFIDPAAAESPIARVTTTLPDTTVTLTLRNGLLSGHTGCNPYVGAYFLGPASEAGPTVADARPLEVADPMAEGIACPPPEGATLQEDRYLAAIDDAERVTVSGRLLWLEASGGRTLLFTAP